MGSRGITFGILLASFLTPWGHVLDSLGKAYLHAPAEVKYIGPWASISAPVSSQGAPRFGMRPLRTCPGKVPEVIYQSSPPAGHDSVANFRDSSQVFSAGSDVALTVAELMDMISMTSLGLVVAYGLIWQEHLSQFS